jgi:PAS domain S-box-containing protein
MHNLGDQWYSEVEQAVEYVSLIDADDNLLYVNHLNDSLESIAGRPVYEFVEALFHDRLREAVAAARESGIPQHFASYATNAEGERSFYSNWVIALMAQPLAGVVAFIATDVTQQARVEDELQLSESMLKSLVDNSPDTIFVVDQDLKLVFASKLEYGFDSEQVLGLSADLFIAEEDRPIAIAEFERVLKEGIVGAYETVIDTPEGPRRFSARLAPIRNRDSIDRVMIVVTDVTDRHEAALAEARLREQLQHAQKMEAIGQLTGGVAHDFNNILLTISGNLELAQLRLDDRAASDEFIEDALRGVQRARELIQRLQAFSRRQPLTPEVVEIAALLDSMHTLLQRTLGENIEVFIDTAAGSGHASRVDRAQLENAVLNLALNARDAMQGGGKLTVAARWLPSSEVESLDAPHGCIRLCVCDTGSGMSAEIVAQAVDPFFTTKKAGHGSGLGLSMVYGFVQQSGGAFRILSEPGEGTTVEIDLPCVRGEAEPLDEGGLDQAAPGGGGELILVVEDDASVRALTAKVLEGLGYRVLTAEDGRSGLALLKERDDLDLLITDVVMPGGMDGFELADQSSLLRPELPVMLFSGHPLDKGDSGERERWLDQLLQKPYRSDELARFVARVLDAGSGSRERRAER